MMAVNNIERTAHVCWFDYETHAVVRVLLTTTGQWWYSFGRGVTQERVAWQFNISRNQCTITARILVDGTCSWVLRSIGLNPTIVIIP